MNQNVTPVLHGVLNSPNLDKLQSVEAVNEYFNSNEREKIRNQNEVQFREVVCKTADFVCRRFRLSMLRTLKTKLFTNPCRLFSFSGI